MKGLILKDLYLLKGLGKQFGIIYAFLFAYSLIIGSSEFMVVYCAVMCGSMVISTMSYDESASFNRYALTMPIDTKALIRAKYILALLIMLMGAGVCCLTNILLNILPVSSGQNFQWEGIGAVVAVFMTANAASIPEMFKLGAEKARYIYIFSMLVIGGVIAGGFFLLDKLEISLQELNFLTENSITVILFAIAAGAMIISYFVSIRIVRDKEW